MSEKEEKIKCGRCKGTGKVGTADSTEGSVDIICLECLGTGIKENKGAEINDEPEKEIR